MSRTSRIPYHQNVYDLLQIKPGESPDAARMIAEHEAQHGPLPASVREWYLVPNIVHPSDDLAPGTLWHTFSDGHWPASVAEVLRQFAGVRWEPVPPWVRLIDENQGVGSWYLSIDGSGSSDPAVWDDNEGVGSPGDWHPVAATFSDFVAGWFGGFYFRQCRAYQRIGRQLAGRPYFNGLWLRTPGEPFEPAVIDYLTEQLGEPERTPRPGNVTTYTFRPTGGTVRVTADEPTLGGGLSAWWLHADTPGRLAELARLVTPFGTLRETLRADTDPAREVLREICGW